MIKHSINMLVLMSLAITSINTFAQNESLYSQYIFNKLVINPAYAGSRGIISTTFLYRNQWAEINGAPETYTFSIHSPLRNDHYNLGFTVYNDRIGAFNQSGFQGIYTYAFNAGNGKLALGIQGGVQLYKTNTSEFEGAINMGDPAALSFEGTEWVPVAGAGMYYHNRFFSAGISVPQILANDIYDNTHTIQNRHYYFTADYLVIIVDQFKLKPSVLFKLVENVKAQVDANLHLIAFNTFSVGAGYRTDQSIVFSGQVYLNKIVETEKVQLILGYAYDLNNNEYRREAGGVHEAMLTMEFLTRTRKVVSPRYF
ncbi:MAG TPA: type IX secretion system membrane protein PorP/SprF [Chitinophagales bacterium]|nr:type IX secretion system membrane protein PorP/SprF [Chitinophagales bacterium]